jgi:PmbA protein
MQKSLEQTAHTAIKLLKKYKVSDYELLLDSSSGVSTAVRLGEVETCFICFINCDRVV